MIHMPSVDARRDLGSRERADLVREDPRRHGLRARLLEQVHCDCTRRRMLKDNRW